VIPWRAKLKAFAAHFLISVAVFAAVVALVAGLYYPPPMFWIDGGLQVTLIAASVDIVLGPLLTFVVFRPGKRALAMNLGVIVLLQVAALSWGMFTMYTERPLLAAFIGYPQNRFFPVSAKQLKNGKRPVAELTALSDERLPLVFIELPADADEARRVLMLGLSGETSVLRQTERYRKIEGETLEQVLAGSRRRELYARDDPPFAREIDDFTAAHGGRLEDYAIIPLYGRFGRALIAIRRADGRYAGVMAREFRLR